MTRFSYYIEMSKRIHPLRAAPRVWNYIKYKSLKRTAWTSVRRYTPQIGSVLLTMRCNLDCGYCTAAKFRQREGANWVEGEANLEKIRDIFSNPLFANCLLADLMGGEPLLVKDLDNIVAYLTENGYMTNTSTNGLLLAQRIVDLKQAGISRINVSLYNENRSIIERDLAGVNKIFQVHASLVLLRSEVEKQQDKLLDAVRFVHDAGCLSLRFWMYRPMGLNPKPEEVISGVHPAYVDFRRKVNNMLPGFCIWPAVVRTESVRKLCAQLWQRVNCDAAGNMGICCGTDAVLQGYNSNLFVGEPDGIFNHPTIVGMREQLLNTECDPPEICKTCNLLGEPGW